MDLDPGVFDRQLDWLCERSRVISLDDALAELSAPGPVLPGVVLTFDDGTDDWVDQVLPRLERRACAGHVLRVHPVRGGRRRLPRRRAPHHLGGAGRDGLVRPGDDRLPHPPPPVAGPPRPHRGGGRAGPLHRPARLPPGPRRRALRVPQGGGRVRHGRGRGARPVPLRGPGRHTAQHARARIPTGWPAPRSSAPTGWPGSGARPWVAWAWRTTCGGPRTASATVTCRDDRPTPHTRPRHHHRHQPGAPAGPAAVGIRRRRLPRVSAPVHRARSSSGSRPGA